MLKEIPQDWKYRSEIYEIIAGCPHIRLPIDVVPERRMFVFEYLQDHLLSLARRSLPLMTIKHILKDVLEGIASLHDLGVSHNGRRAITVLMDWRVMDGTDIKANNILIQTKESSTGVDIEKVEITDLEDAVQLRSGQVLKGAKLGNFMWRSPEAHAEGPMELPSDIFAFGIVVRIPTLLSIAGQQPPS